MSDEEKKVIYVDSSRFPKDQLDHKPGMVITKPVHASDISQERVDETAKRKHEWVGLTDEEIEAIYDQENHADVVLLTQAKLKEKNA